MSKQILIVLDTPPLEQAPWAELVFRRAKLAPTRNQEVSDAMSADPQTREVLLHEEGDPMVNAEKMAPHYRKAFEKLYGREPRVGLYGTAWLVYAPHVDACVVDWSEVERRASAPGVDPADGEIFMTQAKTFVRERAARHMSPDRLLELDAPMSDEERAQKVLDFLAKLGLASTG